MNMKAKLISTLLVVVFLLEVIPLTVSAADVFSWELTEGGTLVLTGSGPMPDYTSGNRAPWFSQRINIRDVSMDSRLTTVGDYAFFGCSNLSSIQLPEGLTAIGENAFDDCGNLESIIFPDSVTEIGARAFADCANLRRVVLPPELTTVAEATFYWCTALNYVEFGEKITTIDQGAFWLSGLTSAELPESLEIIGDSAFASTNLRRIDIPDGVTFIGKNAFSGCAKLLNVTIPASVTEIGELAFDGIGLQSISVAKSNRFYASDAAGALYDKSMSTLIRYPAGRTANSYTMPSGVEVISDYAFSSSSRLTTVNLPDSLETIGYGAFSYCPLIQHMVFPESISSIDGHYLTKYIYGFPLKSAVFEGDAPDSIRPGDDSSSPSFDPDTVTIYYLANASGWSTPTWNGYNTCPILAAGSESLYQNGYYRDLNTYFFHFVDYQGAPLTDVTVDVDGISISSGEASSLSFAAIANASSIITISREGYYPVELPLILFDYINDVALYPLTYTEPFVQAAFIKKSNQSRGLDLLFEGTIFHAGDLDELTTLYLDINWAGWNPGEIFMSQTLDMSELISLREGYNPQTNYSAYMKPGSPVYIHMLTAGGIYRRKLPVNVVQAVVEAPLDTGEDFEIPMPEDDDFLSQFSIGVDLFENLKYTLNVESNGTVKGIIGVEIDTDSKSTTEVYDNIVDQLAGEDANDYGNTVTDVASIIKRFSKGGPVQAMPPMRSKFVVTGEASVIGYFNGTLELDNNDELYVDMKECKLGIAIGGKVSETIQMYTANGMPFYIGSDLSAKMEFIPTLFNESGRQLFVEPMEVKGSVDIKVRGGLGWDSISSVGIYGTGGLHLESHIPIQEDATDLYVTASFGAEARVFCFSADFEICKVDDLYLIGSPDARMMRLEDFDLSTDENWKAQQRDYLYAGARMRTSDTRASISGTTLYENIYPYTALQYGILDNGTEILVWTGDDGEREESNNRTSLFYAYKRSSQTSWTGPKKVESTDTGTGDFNPVLYINGNQVYLAWQDADRPLTAEDTLSTTASAMDITVAKLNIANYTFQILGKVSTAGYDGAQSLTLKDSDELCVVWASSTDDDILTPDGSVYTLNRAIFTEDEIVRQTLVNDLGYIDQTCCDGDRIWFAMDTDLEGSTISDREIFLFDGDLSQLTENDVADTKAAFAGDVSWYQNGAVHTASGEVPLLENTDVYQYLQSPSGYDCVVYTVTDAERITSLFASFNNGASWGDPILIEGGNGNIGDFSASLLEDGSLRIAVAERSVSDDLTLGAGANLRLYTFAPTADISLDSISYQPGSLVAGGTLSVYADLTNNGSTAVDLVEVNVYDGADLIDSFTFLESIPSGASSVLIFPLELEDVVPESLTFEINDATCEDADSTDNSRTLTLHHSDISLEDAYAWSDGSSAELVVLAANRGLADLSGFTVRAEDEDGNVLASAENVSLAVNGSEYLTFNLNAPLESGAVIQFKAIAPDDLTENISANNRLIAKTVSTAGTTAPKANLYFSNTDSATRVIAELTNSPFGSEFCTLFCALYNEHGKMLSVASDIYQPGDQDVQFTFPVTVDFGGSARLYVLDSNYAPVDSCISKSIR